jgi:hypothetical protein
MDADEPLCLAVQQKIQEQIERTCHLISLLPADQATWIPATPHGTPVSMLLGHLLDCLAGFCAVMFAAEPERLAHFAALRELPVNQACSAAEALIRMDPYRVHIDEGFALLTDPDLARAIPTVFMPRGELLLQLLIGNLEHLINHKHELFTCLKQMGVPVRSSDLYCFRGV